MAAGDKVALFYCSGNRDAEVFTSPGTLDLRRERAQHVVSARSADRWPQPEVGEPEFVFSEFVRGVRTLPVAVVR